VNDPAVIEAMSLVPREEFVPDEVRPLAYMDRSLPLDEGRELPAPAVVGRLLTALAPLRGERALVVGAASGYSAAVMAKMGLETVAVESSAELAAAARRNRIDVVEGALAKGSRKGAPYDLILIDGAIEYVPDELVDQLADGGRLGGAIIEQGVTRLFVGRRVGGGFGFHSITDAATPALPGFQRPRAFTF
jgi:protein-L-isoaspartate(D-aspartate) O-methyltransferase